MDVELALTIATARLGYAKLKEKQKELGYKIICEWKG